LLSVRVTGRSKSLQIEEHRAELEEALGLALDQVVRSGGRAAYVAGRIHFRVGATCLDSRGLPPWVALPPENVARMEDLRIEAKRLLTIENLIPFEVDSRPRGTRSRAGDGHRRVKAQG
jgi:hypothetical protein